MVLGQVQGGSCLIKLQPDEAWLSDEARVYPVTIDPATTTSKSADEIFDAHTDAENPGSNYQQSNILKTRDGDYLGGRSSAESDFGNGAVDLDAYEDFDDLPE